MRPKTGRPRSPRWALVLVAVLGGFAVLGGLGLVGVGGEGGAGAAGSPSRQVRATAGDDGLHVRVTAASARTSGTVRFSVRATDAHTRGALGYDVAFGDGTSARSEVPQFCMAGDGVSRRDQWNMTHHYASGTYRVSVTVRANCTGAAATARLTVRPD